MRMSTNSLNAQKWWITRWAAVNGWVYEHSRLRFMRPSMFACQ